MKLTIDIPDEVETDVRNAFMQQDQPATDEQLVAKVQDYLYGTTARVIESEERAAANTRKRDFLAKAGVADIFAADVAEAVIETDERK